MTGVQEYEETVIETPQEQGPGDAPFRVAHLSGHIGGLVPAPEMCIAVMFCFAQQFGAPEALAAH